MLDYGVGVESVGFVTLGVEVLVEYLVLFGIYGGQARGTIDAKGVAQRFDDLREAIRANAVMRKNAEAYVQDHMLELSEHMPAMVVDNGPNYGVAKEAALKLASFRGRAHRDLRELRGGGGPHAVLRRQEEELDLLTAVHANLQSGPPRGPTFCPHPPDFPQGASMNGLGARSWLEFRRRLRSYI